MTKTNEQISVTLPRLKHDKEINLAMAGRKTATDWKNRTMTWSDFLKKHKQYFECEPPEIRAIIEGNCKYYSEGVLPPCVPTLAGRPRAVISETDDPGIPSFGKGTA